MCCVFIVILGGLMGVTEILARGTEIYLEIGRVDIIAAAVAVHLLEADHATDRDPLIGEPSQSQLTRIKKAFLKACAYSE